MLAKLQEDLPYVEPFYTQNGTTEGLMRGVNYGAAHAKILSPNNLCHQSLNHQLRQVFETVQLLELQLDHENSHRFIRFSLFYLSFGKDDYIDLFLRNFTRVMARYNDHQFAEILVNQMVHAMMNLYDIINVKKMVLMGVSFGMCTEFVVPMADRWQTLESTKTKETDCNFGKI